MGILLRFLKEIHDEVTNGLAQENADKACEEVMEYLKNGQYPPDSLFETSGNEKKLYTLFDENTTNTIAYYILNIALYNGLNTRNNTNSMDVLLSEVVEIPERVMNSGLVDIDLENTKEYLSNKEFLEKYNFTDDVYQYVDVFRKTLKEEIHQIAAICSYVDTIIHFSELFMEYFNNFGEENRLQAPITYFADSGSFESAVTKKIKKTFFTYYYKNILYFENTDEAMEKGLYHPNSEVENPYSLYNIESFRYEDWLFSPSSYEALEKEFELFYIEDGISDFKKFSISLKTILNQKISNHFFALESLKEKVAQFKALKQGEDGENYAYDYLKEHLPDNWVVLQNINTPYKDSQRENDIIVINEKGIFTLEVKNYIGGSLEIKNDGKVIHKRGKETVDDKQDIIEQSENHVSALTAFLEQNYPIEGINWHDLVKGIVVISNDEMTINNESSYPIFRTSLVRPYILNIPNNVLNKEQIEEIKNLMVKTSKDDVKFPYMAYVEKFYNEDFPYAIKNAASMFFEEYVKVLDGIDDPMNLAQSLVCYPVKVSSDQINSATGEKERYRLLKKLANIFDEENMGRVEEIFKS